MDAISPASRSPSPDFSPLAVGTDLTPLPAYKAAGTISLDFDGLLDTGTNALKLHEDLSSGCGGQTWPAGMVLAKHMLRYHGERLRTARILELGAGGGLVGLAVARGVVPADGATHPLYITDQQEMFDLMKHNIKLNGLEARVKAQLLNWGEPLGAEILDLKPDVILAADCVYFEPAFPLLLVTLTDLLVLSPTATVYFCFKKRRRADTQFLKKAQKSFDVKELPDEDKKVFEREGLFLFSFKAKAK